MSAGEEKPAGSEAAQSYVVAEGKKRGSTREVRMAAREDRWYKVAKVHAGEAILTDNWHTDEVLSHLKSHFEGHTFAERTLEAWGARVEDGREDTAYYTAGGRVWVLELVDAQPKAQESDAAVTPGAARAGSAGHVTAPAKKAAAGRGAAKRAARTKPRSAAKRKQRRAPKKKAKGSARAKPRRSARTTKRTRGRGGF